MPTKIAITIPNSETALSPRLITTSRSIPIETWPNKIEAPDISNAKTIKL